MYQSSHDRIVEGRCSIEEEDIRSFHIQTELRIGEKRAGHISRIYEYYALIAGDEQGRDGRAEGIAENEERLAVLVIRIDYLDKRFGTREEDIVSVA